MPRPLPKFNDFIGQKTNVDRLRRFLKGATQRGEPFPHCIFSGPSGVGKTKLAKALTTEFGTTSCVCYGDITISLLAGKLTQSKFGDFVIIDEAHNLSRDCQELLYRAIDEGVVPLFDQDEGSHNARNAEKTVQRCTIILATDQPGSLQKAMRRRIDVDIHLDYYSIPELTKIVAKICSDANILISPQAANAIATISRGLPGAAKKLVGSLRLWYPDAEKSQLGKAEIDNFCVHQGIDPQGLTDRDHKYLDYVRTVGKASLASIALMLGLDEAEVQRFVEPFLARLGLIQIAPGGRVLTDQGRSCAQNEIKIFQKG